MRETLLQLLYDCIDELNQQRAEEEQIPCSPHTRLFDGATALDSLAFVNLVALVEDRCERRFGIVLSVGDGTAEDGAEPFNTVGDMVDVLEHLLLSHGATR